MQRINIPKQTIFLILVISSLVFSITPALDQNHKRVKVEAKAQSGSNPEVLVLYSSLSDFNLAIALAHEINVALVGYNVSASPIRNVLPISLADFQTIWWFASSSPSISPFELFGNSTSSMDSWFASRKGFFAITSHLSQMDLSIREALGLQDVSPSIYPLNGSEIALELEVITTKVLPRLQNGSRITLSSKAGFFVPKTETDIVAKANITGEFSNLSSGLLVSQNPRQLSALLSFSVSSTWLENVQFNVSQRISAHSHTTLTQSFNALDFLQIVASFTISGKDSASDGGGQLFAGLSNIMLNPLFLGFLGLVIVPILFVGFKTGRAQRFLFGIYSSTVFFIAHVAYSPSNRRLDRDELLANELRAQIVDFLREKGPEGAHIREIKRTLGCGMSSVLWHLQTLDDFEMVSSTKLGRYHVFYLKEFVNATAISPEIANTIRGETTRRICLALVHKPKTPQTLPDIAEIAGCRIEAARYHLRKLIEVGVVIKIRDQSKTYYSLQQELIPEIQLLASD